MAGLVGSGLFSGNNLIELDADSAFRFGNDRIIRVCNEHNRLLVPLATLREKLA